MRNPGEISSGGVLPLAFATSLLLHALGVGILVVAPSSSSNPSPEGHEPAAEEPLREPFRPLIRLGSQTSQAYTLTWIGYDEETPHVATPSDLDQAAQSPGDPLPPTNRIPDEPTPPSPITAQADAQSSSQPSDPSPAAAQAVEELIKALSELARTLEETGEQSSETGEALTAASSADSPDQTREFMPLPEPQPKQLPPPRQTPQPASPESGNRADRESVATSTLQAAKEDLGKPLAAHGLEIRTVRPRFSHFTRLTARPRDPLLRIQFDHLGRVYDVEVIRSSGNEDVDRNLRDAAFQWRAAGEPLAKLRPGEANRPPETIAIQITIRL